MSPAAIDASAEPTASRHEKKHKKEKKHKSDKKRAREDEEAVVDEDDDAAQRKHKKSRSETGDEEGPDVDGLEKLKLVQAADDDGEGKPKKKKSKKVKVAEDEAELDTRIIAPEEPQSERKKSKKKRRDEADADAEAAQDVEDGTTHEKPKKKKSKRHSEAAAPTETPSKSKRHTLATDADAMDIDEPAGTSSHFYQPPDMPPKPQFPFYSQTISLYEPIYPQGWSQPVTSCQYQHLEHLKNRYVPSLRGVLLDYKNVTLGDAPGRAGAAKVDEDPAVLKSLNEYAVGFGWITADVDLFVPSRGAWMEGSVNLQTEGHIGVVCFGKFNASIEARRLPPAWKWVSNDDPGAVGMEETASVITADDHGVVRQIHSTGFWVDGSGDKIKGKIRFRIRNFDVGISGETSFLSLEGTMLDKDSEKKLVKEEAVLAAQRKGKKGGRKLQRRRAPEFAMTRFADDADDRGAVAEETETQDQTAEMTEAEE